jgi:uncharacterized SAM-binding protein YcdF (DUF218 family)
MASAPFVLESAGSWLVVQDDLQPARAIVVLTGYVPLRAMEAAAIYNQGWAPEVWLTPGGLTKGESVPQLDSEDAPEQVLSRKVLLHAGVPDEAIHVLPGTARNTAEEVKGIAQELRAKGGDRVIVVTTKAHARRVIVTWRRLVGARPQAIVRYTPQDPFQTRTWWRNRWDARTVSREWLGLLYAWTGFPLAAVRQGANGSGIRD